MPLALRCAGEHRPPVPLSEDFVEIRSIYIGGENEDWTDAPAENPEAASPRLAALEGGDLNDDGAKRIRPILALGLD